MKTAAITRRKLRRWSGTMSLSAGTAVFSGAVAILVDRLVRGGSLRWIYLVIFTVLGIALSGGGAWLVATVKSAVGVSLAAMDRDGDIERYQDEADSFARFGRSVFTAQTTVQAEVSEQRDLPLLRSRLRAALHTLAAMEHHATETGLLFQGRPEVGFHVGRWLNQASSRIDLYTDIRGASAGVTHLAAVRLTPALQTPPRRMDMLVCRDSGSGFSEPKLASLTDLPGIVGNYSGECMALGVNLNGPVDEAGFVEPVLRSARREGARAVVFLALPAPDDDPEAPGRQLRPSRQEYESTVAAVIAVAKRLRAVPGLLFLKTPAMIPVALGRYLYGNDWVPMRYDRSHPGAYVRFSDPGPELT